MTGYAPDVIGGIILGNRFQQPVELIEQRTALSDKPVSKVDLNKETALGSIRIVDLLQRQQTVKTDQLTTLRSRQLSRVTNGLTP
ncbi:MAG: hypothetical protein ABNH38_18650 [Tateyamaria sp.]